MLFDTVIPLVLFPSISALAYTLLNPNIELVEPFYRSLCEDGSKNYIHVTHHAAVDDTLCVVVSLFHAALEEKEVASPFNTYFLLTFLPALMLFIFLESGRTRSATSVCSYAGLAVGCCAQIVTFAVTTPMFWLYFVLVARQQKGGGPSQAHAGASVIGMVAGWVVPSLLLITQEKPVVTLLFQPAPIYAFASQVVYSFVSPQSKATSGTGIAQAAYVAWFIIAAGIHVNMGMRHFADWDGLTGFFIPTMTIEDAPRAILNIFQWDFIFAVGASGVGTLWFARSVTEVVGLLMWYVVASVVVGPGAAFSAVALWRESRV